MPRKPTGKASNAWQWSRTAETRRVLLEAASAVFVQRGFAEASVAEVVERASSSVGSLYHHFGGKTELFLALWEDHETSQEQRAITAVAKARADGEEDRLELFIVGARAFMEGAWLRRDLIRLFMDGDGPPGFTLVRRASNREWIRQNAVLLEAGADPVERMTVSILTSIIGEASREIATCGSKREANRVIEATVRLIHRLDPLRDDED